MNEVKIGECVSVPLINGFYSHVFQERHAHEWLRKLQQYWTPPARGGGAPEEANHALVNMTLQAQESWLAAAQSSVLHFHAVDIDATLSHISEETYFKGHVLAAILVTMGKFVQFLCPTKSHTCSAQSPGPTNIGHPQPLK